MRLVDLTGQKFGKLLVKSLCDERHCGKAKFLCECECGAQVEVLSYALVSGNTKSCGCNRANNLVGQRFSKLLVINRASNNGPYVMWNVVCDCGNSLKVRADSLADRSTQSCGCLHKSIVTANVVGKRFGKLYVLEATNERKNGSVVYLVICDCGNIKTISAAGLLSSRIKSCGCLIKDVTIKRCAKPLGEAAFNAVYGQYKKSANKRSLKFDLTRIDAKNMFQSKCFYCGAAPSRIRKSGDSTGEFKFSGIDRIDSSKGYTLDNCVPCCSDCNYAKRINTVDEFKSWAKRLYDNLYSKEASKEPGFKNSLDYRNFDWLAETVIYL